MITHRLPQRRACDPESFAILTEPQGAGELVAIPRAWLSFRRRRLEAFAFGTNAGRDVLDLAPVVLEAAEACVGCFLTANAPPGESVEAWFGGQKATFVAHGDHDVFSVSCFQFEVAMGLCWVVRRPELARGLAGTYDVIGNLKGEWAYERIFCDALRGLAFEDPAWRSLLANAEARLAVEQRDDEFLEADRFRRAHLTLPQIRLLAAWADRDAKAFNERLVDALEKHYAFWSRPDLDLEVDGRIAWLLAGICARAHDDGMPIDVECEYVPGWLVRGEHLSR